MNKTSLLLFGFLALVCSSFSVDNGVGITFFDGKYSDAKKLAAETGKTIFIDGYTEWCKPCKQMATTVFTDKDIAIYFNQTFINVKMDMEKTDGMLVSRRYNVNFYPTLLFLKPDGSLIRKEVGFHDKAQLLQLAKEVSN